MRSRARLPLNRRGSRAETSWVIGVSVAVLTTCAIAGVAWVVSNPAAGVPHHPQGAQDAAVAPSVGGGCDAFLVDVLSNVTRGSDLIASKHQANRDEAWERERRICALAGLADGALCSVDPAADRVVARLFARPAPEAGGDRAPADGSRRWQRRLAQRCRDSAWLHARLGAVDAPPSGVEPSRNVPHGDDVGDDAPPAAMPPPMRLTPLHCRLASANGEPSPPQARRSDGMPLPAAFAVHPISFGYPAELFRAPLAAARRPFGFFPFVTPYTSPTSAVGRRTGPAAPAWPTLDDPRDEPLLHEAYRRSRFVLSHRRGGWDCWRLLEALARGALPFIPDLPRCMAPPSVNGTPAAMPAGGGGDGDAGGEAAARNGGGDAAAAKRALESSHGDPLCLGMYPKHLLQQARRLPGVAHMLGPAGMEPNPLYFAEVGGGAGRVNPVRMPDVETAQLRPRAFEQLAAQAHRFARLHLTTASVARSVLDRMVGTRVVDDHIRFAQGAGGGGTSPPPRLSVLLLVRNQPSYMGVALEHGLAHLGINYTVNFERPYLRRPLATTAVLDENDQEAWDRLRSDDDAFGLRRLHGKGVGYAFRIPPLRNPVAYVGADLERRVASGAEFDFIIYAFHEPPALLGLPMLSAAVGRGGYDPSRVAIVDDNDSFDGSDARLDWAAEAASVATLFRREPFSRGGSAAYECG